jgi:hypothetical protein
MKVVGPRGSLGTRVWPPVIGTWVWRPRDRSVWMVPVSDDRSAALLIRVWLEGDHGAMRARLTTLLPSRGDEAPDEVAVAVVASASDVLSAVGEWLDDVLGHGREPIDDGA